MSTDQDILDFLDTRDDTEPKEGDYLVEEVQVRDDSNFPGWEGYNLYRWTENGQWQLAHDETVNYNDIMDLVAVGPPSGVDAGETWVDFAGAKRMKWSDHIAGYDET